MVSIPLVSTKSVIEHPVLTKPTPLSNKTIVINYMFAYIDTIFVSKLVDSLMLYTIDPTPIDGLPNTLNHTLHSKEVVASSGFLLN